MQNDRNKLNNRKKWNNEEGKDILFHFPCPSFAIHIYGDDILKKTTINLQNRGKPSNQQKQNKKTK